MVRREMSGTEKEQKSTSSHHSLRHRFQIHLQLSDLQPASHPLHLFLSDPLRPPLRPMHHLAHTLSNHKHVFPRLFLPASHHSSPPLNTSHRSLHQTIVRHLAEPTSEKWIAICRTWQSTMIS